jgi:AAA15 family ATPase/GTPase
MIKEFSFGNYRSFKEVQSLNMTASKIKEHIDTNLIEINEKQSLLKSKAIYGANASGKSNIVKALIAFINIINSPVKDEKNLFINYREFRFSDETANKPSFFQLIFEIDNVQYRYGFEATKEIITSEWLFGIPNEREVTFFIREKDKIIEISEKHFAEGHKFVSFNIFKKNSLFLSTLAFLNGELSKQIIDEINSITVLNGLEDKQFLFVGDELKNIEKKAKIINFLKIADIGINSIDGLKVTEEFIQKNYPEMYFDELKSFQDSDMLISYHNKYNSKNEKLNEVFLSFEDSQSAGTKKMFELSSFIIDAIEKGKTIVIDEFDARFHPLISKRIVELFNSKENKKTQLIFVTHDTNLLSTDLLRRDQIDFVEKDKYGASHLYSLVQFKGVRNTASIQKDYINGKYGAIPFLGDFNQLFKTEEDA